MYKIISVGAALLIFGVAVWVRAERINRCSKVCFTRQATQAHSMLARDLETFNPFHSIICLCEHHDGEWRSAEY